MRLALAAIVASTALVVTADPAGAQTCSTVCPPGAVIEAEPPCGPDTPPEDIQCLSPVDLPCSDASWAWCGTYGHYTSPIDSSETRDVDFFRLTLATPSLVMACVCGPDYYDVEISEWSDTCAAMSLCYAQNSTPGEEICCTIALAAGTYRMAVTDVYSSPCGTPYRLRVTGLSCPPVGVESSRWARVKTLYRD